MNKIKQKLQARAKFNKGKRVGYAKGRPVVDRETGELLEDFKPTPKPAPKPAPAPAPAPTPAPAFNQLQHQHQHLHSNQVVLLEKKYKA
jgi:hypothetical protein